MNYEPQKFFVGVIDLFSVLLPGAVLTFLLKEPLWKLFLYNAKSQPGPSSQLGYPSGAEGVAVFLITSYLLGHFIFLIGSYVLDERLYDPIRRASYGEQITRLAKGKRLSPAWARILANIFVSKGAMQPLRLVVKIKEHYLDPLNASSSVNAFQWSKARLTLNHPKAMASVQRFEADSKFFRSLFIVLCLLFPLSLLMYRYLLTISCMPLSVLAFWRYFDQRGKATNQAYWYILTLESQCENGYAAQPNPQSVGFTHAGGVVYKQTDQRVEYLVVQSSKNPLEWVLPKGHIDSGEPMRETAVREVREEAGVWATIDAKLSETAFTLEGKSIKVQFYLMNALSQEKPLEPRDHQWLDLEKALAQLHLEDHRQMLKLADEKRTAKNRAKTAVAGGAA